MIATPRLWVKNKRVQLEYDGRKSERVILYHGSRDRVLIYLEEPGEPRGVYVFDPPRGLWFCPPGDVRRIKLLAFTLVRESACAGSETGRSVRLRASSDVELRFESVMGRPAGVTWMPPPR